MAQKGKSAVMDPSGNASLPTTAGFDAVPADFQELLGKVEKLLQENQVEQALNLIGRTGGKSAWATNALGVCQLRLGNAKVAVDLFRGLVLASGGLILRQDVPTVFKTNYATALLLTGNITGCIGVLHETRDDRNPTVLRLHEAVRNWKKGLKFWQRIAWWMGSEIDRPVRLDFPSGDLR